MNKWFRGPVAAGAIAGLLLGAAGAALPMSSSQAAIAGSCVEADPSYISGAASESKASVFGTRAWIEYENPDLCQDDTTSPSLSVAWSMVTAISAHYPASVIDAHGWAQTGYGQFGSRATIRGLVSGVHVFSQYTYKCKSYLSCTGERVSTEFGGGVSVSHRYEDYQRSDGKLVMSIDGTTLDTSNYDPFGDWDREWAGQVAGETFHKQSDIPGTSSDPVNMWGIQKYAANGSTSYYASLTAAEQPGSINRYHNTVNSPASGGQGLAIYTSPLNGY